MVLLPLLSAFVIGLRTKLRPREKWATCQMAAYQIIDQIYKYRLRTDKYDTQALMLDANGEEVPAKQKETNARQFFVDACTKLYSDAISTEVSKGGALFMGKMAKMQPQDSEQERILFEHGVKKHIKEKIFWEGSYTVPTPKPKGSDDSEDGDGGKKKAGGKRRHKVAAVAAAAEAAMTEAGDMAADAVGMGDGTSGGAAVDLGAKKTGGIDDLVSQMPIEAYIDCRVRHLAALFERRAVIMSRRATVCEAATTSPTELWETRLTPNVARAPCRPAKRPEIS